MTALLKLFSLAIIVTYLDRRIQYHIILTQWQAHIDVVGVDAPR